MARRTWLGSQHKQMLVKLRCFNDQLVETIATASKNGWEARHYYYTGNLEISYVDKGDNYIREELEVWFHREDKYFEWLSEGC